MSVFDSAWDWSKGAYTDARDYVDSTFTGSGFEKSVKEWKKNNKSPVDAIGILNPAKKAWESWSNDYAYISWGGNYLAGDSNNFFIGNGSTPQLQGLFATYEEWSKPTTKNIIEWSKRLSNNASQPAVFSSPTQYAQSGAKQQIGQSGTGKGVPFVDPQIPGTTLPPDEDNISGNSSLPGSVVPRNTFSSVVSTSAAAQSYAKDVKDYQNKSNEIFGSGGSITGVGNLKYDWKDFSFVKEFGRISNNYLITLRRFKLPVLDNGVIAGKEKFVKAIKRQNVQNDLDYVTSDSARALTYFGEGSGNDFNSFVGFTVGLNWDTQFNALYDGGANPTINDNYNSMGSGGSSNAFNGSLTNTIDMSAFITKGKSTDEYYGDENATAALKSAAAKWGGTELMNAYGMYQLRDQMRKQTGDQELTMMDALALTSPDMDPFKNSLQHRIYGPINVITRTTKRKRGLNFSGGSITLTFKYDVGQIENMNQKIAMIDIISNMLALTYNSGKFYGGDYRFHRGPTNFPLSAQLQDEIEKLISDDPSSSGSTFTKAIGEQVTQQVQYSLNSLNYLAGDVKAVAGRVGEYIEQKMNSPELKDIKDQLQNWVDRMNNLKNNNSIDGPTIYKEFSNVLGGLSSFVMGNGGANTQAVMDGIAGITNTIMDSGGAVSTVIKTIANVKMFDQKYDIQSILNRMFLIKPMTTGEPVGEWHITVGNPMNPAMMIGNLVCTGMSMSFGKTLGMEDFPTEVEFKVSLDHARDRDMGDIESMFNYGQGRFYVPVKKDGVNVPQPWESGFSSRNTENDTGAVKESQSHRINEKADGTYTDAMYGVSSTPFTNGSQRDGL